MLVVGEDIKAAIAPFRYDESLPPERQGPDARFDWCVVGGRWSSFFLTLDGRSVATARHRDIDWAGWRDRSRRNAEEAFTAWTNDPRQGGPPMAPRPDDGESRADFVARTGVPITHAILHDGILEESDDYVSIEGTGWAAR